MKITFTIITLNEEDMLPICLNSIAEVADEIIVVDSGSSDHTEKIAKQFTNNFYFRTFDNFANQKNFAVSKAKNDWVFSIDADEALSPGLISEIKKLKTEGSVKYSGFAIPRNNYIFGKFIKHTRWQPELDRHIWLWKKDSGRWQGDVHEEVVLRKGSVGKLRHPKIHNTHETVSDFFQMMNSYSEYDACKQIKSDKRYSTPNLLFSPIYNFMVRYFYRLGVLDGWRGFVLSYMMGIYHFIVWVKVWEKEKQN